MKRILVMGSSGVGKSTFATRLGRRLDLPVLHLDAIWYGPDWTPGDPDAFAQAIEAASAGERWIIEGNFIDHAAGPRLRRAEAIVLLDQPMGLRLWRAGWRGFAGRPRPDLPAGCRDGLDPAMFADILAFDRQDRPRIEAAIASAASAARVLRPRGDGAIAEALEVLATAANHPS